MKYVIENKSKAKDRDIIEIIANTLDYMKLIEGETYEYTVKEIKVKITCKKATLNFNAEDI